MRFLRVALLVACVFLLALIIRVRHEHGERLSAARGASNSVEKGILLAESARWTWPVGDERPARLEEALDLAERIVAEKPEDARAIAEEVRASLYAVRVGRPGHPGVLARANTMIVDLLASRDGLDSEQKKALSDQYEKYDGPAPGATAVSSVGFCLWLLGLWLSTREKGKRRLGALTLAVAGLGLFLGFIAIA